MSALFRLLVRIFRFLLQGGTEFEWIRGETPLSSPIWPIAGMTAYLAMIVVLKAMIQQPVSVPRLIAATHNLVLCLGSAAMFIGCAAGLFKVRTRPAMII